jgi:hypothetical protein
VHLASSGNLTRRKSKNVRPKVKLSEDQGKRDANVERETGQRKWRA